MQPANILLLSKERINTQIQIKVNFPVILMTYFCHNVGMNTERWERACKLLICVKKSLKKRYFLLDYSSASGSLFLPISQLLYSRQASNLWHLLLSSSYSADERFDATFHTNVLVNATGICQYIPPGCYPSGRLLRLRSQMSFFKKFSDCAANLKVNICLQASWRAPVTSTCAGFRLMCRSAT